MAEQTPNSYAYIMNLNINGIDKQVQVDQDFLASLTSSDPMIRHHAYGLLEEELKTKKAPTDGADTENIAASAPANSPSVAPEPTCTVNSQVQLNHIDGANTENENIAASSPGNSPPVAPEPTCTVNSQVQKLEQAQFSKEVTKMIIALYRDMKTQFQCPTTKKKALWMNLTVKLNDTADTQYNWKQVEGRWKTVLSAYRKHKDNQNKSGTNRKEFEYEKMLDDILGDSPTTTPICTVSSLHSPDSNLAEDDNQDKGEPKQKKKRTSVSTSSKVIDYMKIMDHEEEKRDKQRMEQLQKMHTEKMNLFREYLTVMKESKK